MTEPFNSQASEQRLTLDQVRRVVAATRRAADRDRPDVRGASRQGRGASVGRRGVGRAKPFHVQSASRRHRRCPSSPLAGGRIGGQGLPSRVAGGGSRSRRRRRVHSLARPRRAGSMARPRTGRPQPRWKRGTWHRDPSTVRGRRRSPAAFPQGWLGWLTDSSVARPRETGRRRERPDSRCTATGCQGQAEPVVASGTQSFVPRR